MREHARAHTGVQLDGERLEAPGVVCVAATYNTENAYAPHVSRVIYAPDNITAAHA